LGDYWQQFANFRLLIGYMMTHPGKKLLFMGNELAPYSEWAFYKELDWHLKKFPSHDSASRFVKELSVLYKNEPALWELDFNTAGFEYIEADNVDQSIYVFARYASDRKNHLVIVMNCTPNTYDGYRIGVPGNYYYQELINSDRDIYGGSNRVNDKKLRVRKGQWQHQSHYVELTVPPLGITILKNIPMPPRKKKTTKQ
jgi:1,4-alpha-glucan branching enzyme